LSVELRLDQSIHTATNQPSPQSTTNQTKQVVADTYEQGDLVLVLDYELMLLPSLLRKRFPDIVCGFFLHCPFPSSEFYRMLPVRQQLLQVRLLCLCVCVWLIKSIRPLTHPQTRTPHQPTPRFSYITPNKAHHHNHANENTPAP
jgi:hypothetical protein